MVLYRREKAYHGAAGDLGLKNRWGVTRTLINKRGRRSYFHGLIFWISRTAFRAMPPHTLTSMTIYRRGYMSRTSRKP